MASKNLPIIDWLEIEASAPAKFIISGEYSVVYEKQAIASTIDLKTKVTIKPNKEGKVRLNLKNLDDIREWSVSSMAMSKLVFKYSECLDFVDNMPVELDKFLNPNYQVVKKTMSEDVRKKANDAVIAFLLLYIGIGDSYSSSARPPISVEVESQIPVGSGLGSSSALSVAFCAALMRVFRVSAEKYIISKWALNVDKFFHGRPSGVDNNIITNGGYILFQNGKIKSSGVVHKIPLNAMLIDTGVSRSTKTLSKIIIDQLRDEPATIETIFNSINEITTRIWRELNDPSFVPSNIAEDLQANQLLLERLGVGHEKLSDIISRARQLNLSAKQTGAGGGGFAFILYNNVEDRDSINQLRNELIQVGYMVHDHPIGCEGVTVKIEKDSQKK